MNTLKSLAESLRRGRKIASDVDLAARTGLTRQSVSRSLSGHQNFTVLTLLALAHANDQVVMLVPREAARALLEDNTLPYESIPTVADRVRML